MQSEKCQSVKKNILVFLIVSFPLKCWSSESDALLNINIVDTRNNDNNNTNITELFCIVCMEGFDETDIIQKCTHNCAANFHAHCWEQCIEREIRYVRIVGKVKLLKDMHRI